MARISISRLAHYAGGIELLSQSSPSFRSILLQGPADAAHKIEKSFAASSFLHPNLPEHVLKPITFKVKPEQNLSHAVFEGQLLSKLQTFLQQGTLLQQYCTGKRLDFMLRQLHELMLPEDLTCNKLIKITAKTTLKLRVSSRHLQPLKIRPSFLPL